MYPFPPPSSQSADKSCSSSVRGSGAAAGCSSDSQQQQHHHVHQHHSGGGNGSSSSSSSSNSSNTHATPDRYLPSLLLHTPAPTPQHPAAATAAAAAAAVAAVPQHPLNNILLQTAQFMAMNEQLRKEIEQYANLRVRAASLKGGPEAQVAAAAAAAYFLSPPVASMAAAAAAAAGGGGGGGGGGELPPSLVASFAGAMAGPGGGAVGARLPPPAPPGRKSPLPDSYKTVMCQAWLEASMCSFGENCRFAHGEHELRPMTQPQRANRKYKTKLCDKYTNTGLCPYGARCLFIHPDNAGAANAYIRPDKLEELKKRQQGENSVSSASLETKEEGSGKQVAPAVEKQAGAAATTTTTSTGSGGVAATLAPDTMNAPKNGAGNAALRMLTSTPLTISSKDNNGHQQQHNYNQNHTGKPPVAPTMSIGMTPIRRQRQSLRPHPSWPLEPSHFFDRLGGEDEGEEDASEEDEEHRVMIEAAKAVAAEAAASVLMNSCGSGSVDGRSARGSCSSSYSIQPTEQQQHHLNGLEQHLPRTASPVIGFEHSIADSNAHSFGAIAAAAAAGDGSAVTSLAALLDCGTPCSGSSSGYLSEGGCGGGVITPASGLSSGTASPLDALMLSGGVGGIGVVHPLGSTPPSMLLDTGEFSASAFLHGSVRPLLSLPLSSTTSTTTSTSSGNAAASISLPPMTSSAPGCWGSTADPFRTAFDIDKMAREMLHHWSSPS